MISAPGAESRLESPFKLRPRNVRPLGEGKDHQQKTRSEYSTEYRRRSLRP
jgi:hypothetical protein